MKTITIALTALMLSGCAALGLDPSVADSAPLDVTGDVSGGIEQNIENTVQQMTWWQFVAVVFLAGWAIPGPGEMFRALFGVFGSMFGGLITLIKTFRR